jgi:hypothetical protein
MIFIPLIMFFDFTQILHSARNFYTETQHFSHYKSFSTISLLQKQRLNHINYSKQELIMELFMSYWKLYEHACKISDYLQE